MLDDRIETIPGGRHHYEEAARGNVPIVKGYPDLHPMRLWKQRRVIEVIPIERGLV